MLRDAHVHVRTRRLILLLLSSRYIRIYVKENDVSHTARARATVHLLGPAIGAGAGKLGAELELEGALGVGGARLRSPGKSEGMGAGRGPSDSGRAHLFTG